MPRRNTRTADLAGTTYHVYNRQRQRRAMFRDDDDRRFFVALFERYLSAEPQADDRGRLYATYCGRVRLWSLTLMGNHFHLVLHQVEAGAIGALMRSVMAVYVRYFNSKYGTSGEMFAGEVRMRPAESRRDELGMVAYAHENHGDHCFCEFCTHALYVGPPANVPDWIDVASALDRFGGVDGYNRFMAARRELRAVAQ